MKKIVCLAAGAAAVTLASSAMAAVEIKADPSFVQPDETVQLDADTVPGDNVLLGTTNKAGSTLKFQSATDSLGSTAQGQARILPLDANGLGQLILGLQNGGTFTTAEFNILADVGGFVTLEALDAANLVLASIYPTLGASGQNFMGFQADGSTPISSIRITAGPGTPAASVGQFRIGGISNAAVGAVPDLATWAMMLVGFGAVGGMMRRKSQSGRARRMRSTHG